MARVAKLAWFLVGFLVFCFALLAVNQEAVAVRFLVWRSAELSLFWWLLCAFVIGLAVGAITLWLASLKHRRSARSLARQLAASQQEVTRLKAPLA